MSVYKWDVTKQRRQLKCVKVDSSGKEMKVENQECFNQQPACYTRCPKKQGLTENKKKRVVNVKRQKAPYPQFIGAYINKNKPANPTKKQMQDLMKKGAIAWNAYKNKKEASPVAKRTRAVKK